MPSSPHRLFLQPRVMLDPRTKTPPAPHLRRIHRIGLLHGLEEDLNWVQSTAFEHTHPLLISQHPGHLHSLSCEGSSGEPTADLQQSRHLPLISTRNRLQTHNPLCHRRPRRPTKRTKLSRRASSSPTRREWMVETEGAVLAELNLPLKV